MKENNKEEIKKVASEAHLKWLKKAEIAIVNGSEMTVLPYGYLSQAIIEVLKEEKKKWEINKEIGLSEVLAFEAGQKEERKVLLEKIEEKIKIHKEIIATHSSLPIDWHEGNIKALEDIKEIIKNQ